MFRWRNDSFPPFTPWTTIIILILLSGENHEHLYLCAYNSAFLTKAAHGGFFASLRRRRKPLKSRRDERSQTGVDSACA